MCSCRPRPHPLCTYTTHTPSPIIRLQADINGVSKLADAIKKRLAELDRSNEAALKRKVCSAVAGPDSRGGRGGQPGQRGWTAGMAVRLCGPGRAGPDVAAERHAAGSG